MGPTPTAGTTNKPLTLTTMIIDEILNRKDGFGYKAREFYTYCNGYDEHGNNIARAMDCGTNTDVQNVINAYIHSSGYNAGLCEYVSRRNWLEDEEPTRKTFTVTPEHLAAFMAANA